MRSLLLLFGLFFAFGLRADVVLGTLFTDGAVLQRDKPLPIWGRANAGERVTVSFAGQSVSTVAANDGRWIVYLDAVAATTTPAELVVAGNNTVRLADIVVGDVWLCSGQSNMEWPVRLAQNAQEEIAAAHNPLVRHIAIKRQSVEQPTDRAETSGWQHATPKTAGDFSAVGYFFARDLQPRLGVPIGIINSSWGGTPIEAWIGASAWASNPAFAVVEQRWKKELADAPPKRIEYEKEMTRRAELEAAAIKANQPKPSFPWLRKPAGPGHSDTPSGLFNGMICPLLPYALRGALWYQGESNAGRASEYHALFSAMITQWRAHFGQGDFPFLWVQLANYKNGNANSTEWAFLREAQTQTLALPATGQAVTIDIGEPDDIHPKNKQEVGRRLALIARAKVYGSTVDYTGPIFAKAKREGATMRVHFSAGAEGLTAHNKPLQSFEIAGADGKFTAAIAKIEGDTVVVSAASVKEPIAVRYAWSNAPHANLYNGAGLPAVPFQQSKN